MLARVCYEPLMSDREITLELAAATRVTLSPTALDPLFALAPELIEWSINSASDHRGTLRVSAWTRDRVRAERELARIAPALATTRAQLVGDDYEGVGLALKTDSSTTLRWWALTGDGPALVERIRAAWPAHTVALDELLAATGPSSCVAVGVEAGADGIDRRTIYARLADPAATVRVLELAKVPASRAANLFFKGICGLEPGGRSWPKVWVGHSLGIGGGWKFYYFARGDELRRTDDVLLEAIAAGPELRDAHRALRAHTAGPCVQLLGLTQREDTATFTAYLAKQ